MSGAKFIECGAWFALWKSPNKQRKEQTMKTKRDENDCAYYPEDHWWITNKLRDLKSSMRRIWKNRILRALVCSHRGHNYDDTEWGHMIGSKTHDQWCARCDNFRGIPCAEHPKYDDRI